MRRFWPVLAILTSIRLASGFDPGTATGGGVHLEIGEAPAWTVLDTPQPVTVKLQNLAEGAVDGQLALGLTDSFKVVGPATQTFHLDNGGTATLTFAVQAGSGTYRAFYPIHATATLRRAAAEATLHAVAIVRAEPPLAAANVPEIYRPDYGPFTLSRTTPQSLHVQYDGNPAFELPGGAGTDPVSRGDFRVGGADDRGGSRPTIRIHPPWADGHVGTIAGEWRLLLPNLRPIRFQSGLAIRDNGPTEPVSDGVTFRVYVDGAKLLEQHTVSKTWQDVSLDLSAFAGKTVQLRLEADPGPQRNTTCDGGYWGAPTIQVGEPSPPESAGAKVLRVRKAVDEARVALAGARQPDLMRLRSDAGAFGVGVAWGPLGLPDAQIAFHAAAGTVVFDGFEIEVSGASLASRLVAGETGVSIVPIRNGWIWSRPIRYEGKTYTVKVTLKSDGAAVQTAFELLGQRDARGNPRFTRIALGPASAEPHRVYFGHGNVVVNAPSFREGFGGFTLSTRHLGVDYANGISFVQASDLIPDALEHNQARRQTSLVCEHDVTLSLVPSTQGAFAAARVWRGLNGLTAGGGVTAIAGKMCLDQWGGDYAATAAGLEKATAYGLDEAVFVKHVWQRWGYDYRLPDIYPPAGDRAGFDAMRRAAKLNGRLFAIHDNYIDFYPDADGFSYDDTVFTEDGQPHKAWIHEARNAQSYRWLPTAFQPFLERNLALMAKNIGPTSLFIDVFSAMGPFDGYDRGGNYFTRTLTQQKWGECFDRVREVLGGPTISEAGHDALVGHLDAAEADHPGIRPDRAKPTTTIPCEDAERVPWFDMVHHRRFVQLAGGLGDRYATGQGNAQHGYASDDYLSMTVLGGRTPMCDGPFGRRAVMTYWLLQPLCKALEGQEMLAHKFVDDAIGRQRVTWEQGTVSVNRGADDWTVDGTVLPSYGLVATLKDRHVDISRRQGVISAMAQGPEWLFVDARPAASSGLAILPTTTAFEDLGGRRYRLKMTWDVRSPAPADARVFIHMCGDLALLPGATKNGDILFQTGSDAIAEAVRTVGKHELVLDGQLPEGLKAGPIQVRYGLYDAKQGFRYELSGPPAGDGRYDGGTITVRGDGPAAKMTWKAGVVATENSRDNTAGKVLDFGPVATNLGLRVVSRADALELTLLPNSRAGSVTLHLEQLGAAGKTVGAIEQLGLDGKAITTVTPRLAGRDPSFDTVDGAFRYRVALK